MPIMHIDGNSFYAACERIFRPDLKNKPIAVLSNNDGVVIALDQICKDMGFKRGDVYFKVRNLYESRGVAVFSSNYTLYQDISNRVNLIYGRYCPQIEYYSIDESFLFFPDWNGVDWTALGREIRQKVQQEVHIPVSVGIAPTKTLAKMCNKLAKKHGGVFNWYECDQDETLSGYRIEDLWNVGGSKVRKLHSRGIYTALDMKHCPLDWAKKAMTVSGFNTVMELNGKPQIDFVAERKRDNITSSKSFAKGVEDLTELETATADYVQHAVSRMRKEGTACRGVRLVLMTGRDYAWHERGQQWTVNSWEQWEAASFGGPAAFAGPGNFWGDRNDGASPREYFNSAVITLPVSTSYLPLIQEAALELLHRLYRPGYQYRNVMVNLLNLENDTDEQLELFDRAPQEFRARNKAVMAAMDRVNTRYGFGTLTTGTRYQLGASTTSLHSQQTHLESSGNWIMQRSLLSPEYTTDLSAIPCVG